MDEITPDPSIMDRYQTLAGPGAGDFRDRGSKFFGYAFPVADEEAVQGLVDEQRAAHHKAGHCCYAYRLGHTGDRHRANDDGEPSGTAGRPILGRIDSRELTNTLVMVVRYWGGTKLGAAGLINAYRTAARLALDDAPVVTRYRTRRFTLAFTYPLMGEVLSALERLEIAQADQRFTVTAEIDIELRRSKADEQLRELKAAIGGVYLDEVDEDYTVEGLEITEI